MKQRKWEKVMSGERNAINCPGCKHLTQKVRASEMICPDCETLVTSTELDGRVHRHRARDASSWCNRRFRFEMGEPKKYSPVIWMSKCTVCEEVKRVGEFSSTQRDKTVDGRKCKECARSGRPITGHCELQCNNTRYTARMQVSELPPEKQDYYKQKPDARIHCNLCVQRGCTAQQPETAMCAATEPGDFCINMGREQGLARFGQTRKRAGGKQRMITACVCMFCEGTHMPCRRCSHPIKKAVLSGRQREGRGVGVVCQRCADAGYRPQDLSEYECTKCDRKYGRGKFDPREFNNKQQGRRKELHCKECRQ